MDHDDNRNGQGATAELVLRLHICSHFVKEHRTHLSVRHAHSVKYSRVI